MAQTRGRNTSQWKRLRARLRREAERNGDRCWICGGEIDYAAPAHSPDSWEPDHVKSVADFPELAEDPSNVRSAHASCNYARGNAKGNVFSTGDRKARLS